MSDRPSLAAETRSVFGRKVAQLRKQGLVPANLVVPGGDSRALQINEHDIATIIRREGRSGLVELRFSDGKEAALLDEVSVHPVNRRLQHVVFRHVDLDTNVQVGVQLELVGDAPADQTSGRFVVREMDEISIECLPEDIPNVVEVDVSGLSEIGDHIRAKDLTLPEYLVLLGDPDAMVVHVQAERIESEPIEAIGDEDGDGAEGMVAGDEATDDDGDESGES
tara:strand:+ start:1879 stop:2547 length:669 start_codon:yes stop_codon:yes gene_type:complete